MINPCFKNNYSFEGYHQCWRVYSRKRYDMVDFLQNLRKNESAKYGCFLKMVAFLAIGETSEIKPRAVIIYLFKSKTVEPL